MSTLAHRPFDDSTQRPPLRLLERRPRPAAVPVAQPQQHAVDRWLDRWLVRWIDGYFAAGERLQHQHRMGSWQSLR
jgi:hypothetical protein